MKWFMLPLVFVTREALKVSRELTTTSVEVSRSAILQEDARFLVSQWSALESQLSQIEFIVDPQNASKMLTQKSPEPEQMVHKSTKVGNLVPLAVQLEMLKGLYEDGKRRVADLNAREKKYKEDYEKNEKKHEAKLAHMQEDSKREIAEMTEREKNSKTRHEEEVKSHEDRLARTKSMFKLEPERLANQTEKEYNMWNKSEKNYEASIARIESSLKLEGERLANHTQSENKLWSYWVRCRERQHRQFHTGLKIQHATMNKVKKMIDMYEKTLSGAPEKIKEAKKEFASVVTPDIVFLQEREGLVKFCRASLLEVHAARAEAIY